MARVILTVVYHGSMVELVLAHGTEGGHQELCVCVCVHVHMCMYVCVQ